MGTGQVRYRLCLVLVCLWLPSYKTQVVYEPAPCDVKWEIGPYKEHVCACPSGFTPLLSEHACEDIDECDTNDNGGCQHTCVNTIGSFYCECLEGHQLQEDGKTCQVCEHSCHDGTCIPETYMCDNYVDCAEGEDEQGCAICGKRSYLCSNGTCIPNFWVCDGKIDCDNGEDENVCAGCGNRQYACIDGTCVSNLEVCDYWPNCPGGEDELSCGECAKDEFTCGSGACIPLTFVCDFEQNCIDGSDEINCEGDRLNVALGKTATQSSTYVEDTAASKAIDGNRNGPFLDTCAQTQYDYEPWWRVDLHSEFHIFKVVILNRKGTFRDRIIGAEVRAGNSLSPQDNYLCGEPVSVHAEGAHVMYCKQKTLGRYVTVQYPGRSDILNVCEVEVYGRDTSNCTDGDVASCNATESGTCDCCEGYRQEENGTCTDIDECAVLESDSPCEQICVNSPGSFYCECLPGYRLHEDGKMCTRTSKFVTFRLSKSNYDASLTCDGFGMMLAKITDFQKYTEFRAFTIEADHGNKFWMDDRVVYFDDESVELQFADGTPSEYHRFPEGEPNGNGPCVRTLKASDNNLKWIEDDCDIQMRYICEQSGADRCEFPAVGTGCDRICRHSLGHLICSCFSRNYMYQHHETRQDRCAGLELCIGSGTQSDDCSGQCIQRIDSTVVSNADPESDTCLLYSEVCSIDEFLILSENDIGVISFRPREMLNCYWRVTVPRGYTITLFIEFYNQVGDCIQPQCVIDYLEITDMEYDQLALVCGIDRQYPKAVYSSNQAMVVKFTKHEVYLLNIFQLVIVPTGILDCPTSIGNSNLNNDTTTEMDGPVIIIDQTMKLPCAGKIKQWQFKSDVVEDGQEYLYLGIYRRSHRTQFTMIGQNKIAIPRERGSVFTVDVSPDDRLSFQPGDFVGIYCPNKCRVLKREGCYDCSSCKGKNLMVSHTSGATGIGEIFHVETVAGAYRIPVVAELQKYCDPQEHECSGCGAPARLTAAEGSFSTMNFVTGSASFYPNSKCRWVISTAGDRFIHLVFDTFDLPASDATGNSICQNYVALYNDTATNDATLVSKFCGAEIPLISSTSNVMTVVFSSGEVVTGRGFTAHYYTTECPAYGMGFSNCGQHFNMETRCGYFQSVGYPFPNPPGCTSTWSIKVPEGDVIELTFLDFNVGHSLDPDCVNNYLKVYNSESPDEAFLYGTFCSSRPSRVISASSEMFVEFRGLDAGGGSGFLAKYFAVPYESNLQINITLNLDYVCQEDGWDGFRKECYKFHSQNRTLTSVEAESRCAEDGAHLVSILDSDESQFVTYAFARMWWNGDATAYIGLKLEPGKHQHRWSDGNPMSFTAWARAESRDEYDQPDGASFERCTVISMTNVHNTNHWHDIPCAADYVKQFICKKPALYVGHQADPPYNGVARYACGDLSWGRYEGVCFKLVQTNGQDSCLESEKTFPSPVSDYELELFAYYVNNIWAVPTTGYIAVQSNVTEEVVDVVEHGCGTSCQTGQNNTLATDLNKSDTCLVLHTEGWSWGLQECMTEYELCNSQAMVNQLDCGDYNFKCGDNVCIHEVRVCDGTEDCLDGSDEENCAMDNLCPTNTFQCANGECISMTFYCDFVDDCGDNSDERFCVYPNCTTTQFRCDNGQCLPQSKRCDLIPDCQDGSDEVACDVCKGFQCYNGDCLPSHVQCDGRKDCAGNEREDEIRCDVTSGDDAQNCGDHEFQCHNGLCINRTLMCIYDFDQYGYQVGCRDVTHLTSCAQFNCPGGMFKCPDSYCIPLHRRCDGTSDCPNGHDERDCDSFTCPGYFRCHDTKQCVPLAQRCDGIKQCPRGDDELACGISCPTGCRCNGYVIDCENNNIEEMPSNIFEVRKLNLTGNNVNISQADFTIFQFLAELDLSNNAIADIPVMKFRYLSNMYILQLSGNNIDHLDAYTFVGLQRLRQLALSNNRITRISDGAFEGLENLLVLDLTGNRFSVDSDALFRPLVNLRQIYTEAFMYCCMVSKNTEVELCTPSGDAFSSCEDLMANSVLRVFVWILGAVALVGNAFVIVWRTKQSDMKQMSTFLIWNLAMSDCLMGVYLFIVASADMYYRGVYVRYDQSWRASHLCHFAGFIATLSSEVSVFALTAITVERFLKIVFPLRFMTSKYRHAVVVAVLGWLVSAVLSALPLMSIPYFGDSYYGRSPVCLSLYLTNETTPGWEYSVTLLFLNFLSFVVILVCYLIMYVDVVRTSKAVAGRQSHRRSKEAAIAKRMTLIVLTDFCCWVPITAMAMLALADAVTIPGTVYAWTAVFLLPVNSAANPILYTISTINGNRKSRTKNAENSESAINPTVSFLHEEMPVSRMIPLPPYTYIPLSVHINTRVQGLKITDVHTVAADVASALEFLHRQDTLHNQVREENILIIRNNDGSIKQAFLSDMSKSKYIERRFSVKRLAFSKDIRAYGVLVTRLVETALGSLELPAKKEDSNHVITQ